MALVRPFKAVRPARDKASHVITLPYDVMNTKEAMKMAKDNPDSFLHISRSEIDLPKLENPYGNQVYQQAAKNLNQYLETGVLLEESKPALYLYRQEMNGRIQTGIVGCVSIDEYADGTIKKHELTRVEKEIDRINHFDACNANTESVFLTYRQDLRIKKLTEDFIEHNHPEYDVKTPDGIRHTLWVVKEEHLIEGICDLFSQVPAFYIADGHHRSASAYKVGKKRRKENPDFNGEEEFNYFMATIFPDQDLRVYDYNRVVKDLNGNSTEGLIIKIERAGFNVIKQGTLPYRPERKHEFSMYLEGNWYKLTARPEVIPEDLIGDLDVSILQDNLLQPILGIDDPRADQRIDFVGGIRGLKELEKRGSSDMKVAFCVYPVSMEDLLNIADHNEIMPPKSTWFEPKIGSGLFMHRL